MLIGGLAVNAWGSDRATSDVDVTIEAEAARTDEVVARLGTRFRQLHEDPRNLARRSHVLFLMTPQGIKVDVAFAVLPFQREAITRAATVEIEGTRVRVCRPEDLILHKVVSVRGQDLQDIAFLISRYRDTLDRGMLDRQVRELADALAMPDIWEQYRRCWES